MFRNPCLSVHALNQKIEIWTCRTILKDCRVLEMVTSSPDKIYNWSKKKTKQKINIFHKT